MAESPRLPWGATLVVVTSIVSDELQAALFRLREVGRRLVLVALEDESTPASSSVPGVRTFRLPLSRSSL